MIPPSGIIEVDLLLHYECEGGNIHNIRTLIREHSVDVNARDNENNTPLNMAAHAGKDKVILALITEFSVSLLHANNSGDTPLHIACSKLGFSECVKTMFKFNAPVLISNNVGQIPRDVATDEAKSLLDKYMKENKAKIYVHYDDLKQHAKRKYSTAEHITRIFVIGNSGAGKSTLIENLKSESIFAIQRIRESSVPSHTVGIVPSIHASEHYDRVLFYDFAGDPEYYSSHAAILENLAPSSKGDNIFIIVVDLRQDYDKIQNILHFWLSFIRNLKFRGSEPSLIVAGSHVDLITKRMIRRKKMMISSFCEISGFHKIAFSSLDCRKPGSKHVIQKEIVDIIKHSPRYKIPFDAYILLGLLEKDFCNVTACSIQTIVSHIEDTGIHLPTSVRDLCRVVNELHEIGLLFKLWKSNSLDSIVALNISQLTNEVQLRLFSEDARFNLKRNSINTPCFNVGIIPESVLQKILPRYITKECLVLLQYCQEISHRDVGVFLSFPPSSSSDQTFLFFPALCAVDKRGRILDHT